MSIDKIRKAAEEFVSTVVKNITKLSIDELIELRKGNEGDEEKPAKGKPGRKPKAKKEEASDKSKKAAPKKTRTRRTEEDVAAASESALAYLKDNKGGKAVSEVAKGIDEEVTFTARVLAGLVKEEKLVKKGEKRMTRYFHPSDTSVDSSDETSSSEQEAAEE